MERIRISTEAGSGGGGGEGEGNEIASRAESVREKILRDAREIVEVLKVDFPLWIRREAKAAFSESPEFASSLTNDQVRAIKKDVDEAADAASREILPALQEWAIWIVDASSVPEDRKTTDLRANAEVDRRIQRVAGHLTRVLKDRGFPERVLKGRTEYVLPARFIAGRLLKSLVESYWRNLEELWDLDATLRALHERDRKSDLEAKWDAV